MQSTMTPIHRLCHSLYFELPPCPIPISAYWLQRAIGVGSIGYGVVAHRDHFWLSPTLSVVNVGRHSCQPTVSAFNVGTASMLGRVSVVMLLFYYFRASTKVSTCYMGDSCWSGSPAIPVLKVINPPVWPKILKIPVIKMLVGYVWHTYWTCILEYGSVVCLLRIIVNAVIAL